MHDEYTLVSMTPVAYQAVSGSGSEAVQSLNNETLLGDKAPILDTLKRIGSLIPGAGTAVTALIDELEERANNAARGKRVSSRKYFSGWTPPNKEG